MGMLFGHKFRLAIYGESHGNGVGGVIDGLPSGVMIDEGFIKKEMTRRAPGRNSLTSSRAEDDSFEILSGLYEGYTTGDPLAFYIKNKDSRSKDYSRLRDLARPGHADYTSYIKAKGFNDQRGGGHHSGRLTAALVFAGAIAKTILKDKGIKVHSHIKSIQDIEDIGFDDFLKESNLEEGLSRIEDSQVPVINQRIIPSIEELVAKAKADNDSVGGIVEGMILGLGPGVGSPFFRSIESVLSSLLFSIPSVKGVEFGLGFPISKLKGSSANDEMGIKEGKAIHLTNNNGGILGGISNGMPIICRVAIKPTPSIAREQNTINYVKLEGSKISIEGRHDPCIALRVCPVVEAALAIGVMDLIN